MTIRSGAIKGILIFILALLLPTFILVVVLPLIFGPEIMERFKKKEGQKK